MITIINKINLEISSKSINFAYVKLKDINNMEKANNLEFLCEMCDVLEDKIDKELITIAKNNPITIPYTIAINNDYFLNCDGKIIAIYGIEFRDENVYINVIDTNNCICENLILNVFGIEDKKWIMTYLNDIINKLESKDDVLGQVMSYRNGHTKSLVDKINWIANDPVRKSLYDEITDFLLNTYNNSNDDDYAEDKWDLLTHICDDVDLNTIINYCRIESFLPEDNKHFNSYTDLVEHFNKPFPINDLN